MYRWRRSPHAVLNVDDFALSTQKGLGDACSGMGALLHRPVLRCQEQVHMHTSPGADASNLARRGLSEPHLAIVEKVS